VADTDLYLGLDVGGTKCAAVIGNDAGTILARAEWPSRAERGPRPMIDDLVTQAQALLAAPSPLYPRERPGEGSSSPTVGKPNPQTPHPTPPREDAGRGASAVRAIGVSIGGPLDARKGIIHSPPNLPGWDAIPLRALLEDIFKLPVFVEHDAAACALAEHRWGAGVGAESLIYLTCATGFGAGYVFGGKAYYGARGWSGEIGHTRYAEDGPEAFGKQGSAEAWCSAKGLSRLAAWKFPRRWGNAGLGPRENADHARAGDADAREVVALNASAVGEICSRLADTLFPDLIVLGSLSRYLGEPWMTQVRATFERETLADARSGCRIVAPGLGVRLQDCSTLAAAMRESHLGGASDGRK
jgi:glucokinase